MRKSEKLASEENQSYNKDGEPLLSFGQPTYRSHPQILKKGEVTPNLRLEEFRARRKSLVERLEKCSMNTDAHIIIVPSSPKKYMTEKIPYVFRQDSDFFYLTGCLEPDSILLLIAQSESFESILFLRGRDIQAELWDGPRTGLDQAPEYFGVDHALPWSDFESYLRSLLKMRKNSIVWYDYLGNIHQQVYTSFKDAFPGTMVCDSPRSIIHELRLYKSIAEQELMRRTCKIGSEAIVRTIETSKPNCNEADLFARVDFECRTRGAQYLAYPPVVAGGNRANIIHYINNNQIVKEGELVLMDAGCELHGYTSDITRTWPVSGSYTREQRALYDLLHTVQTRIIEELSNRPSLTQLFQTMCVQLGRGLREVGVISAPHASDDELSRIAYNFCPHHVGHYLGLDVHDTSTVSRNLKVEPGMVITVEPGIYVNSANKIANPVYHGIGMRIEDDVLITDSGCEVLTSDCPKHPEAIQELLRNRFHEST